MGSTGTGLPPHTKTPLCQKNEEKHLMRMWFRLSVIQTVSTCRGSQEGAWSVSCVDRKDMEAKALQTIDTLYITSYSYNNIAGTQCTDKTELYGWRKLLVYSIQQTAHVCPDLLNLLFRFYFDPFSLNPSSLFSLLNSSQVSIFMYIAEHSLTRSQMIQKIKTEVKARIW